MSNWWRAAPGSWGRLSMVNNAKLPHTWRQKCGRALPSPNTPLPGPPSAALGTLLLELRAPAAHSLVPQLSSSSTPAAASAAKQELMASIVDEKLNIHEQHIVKQCLAFHAADRPDLYSLMKADGGCLQLAFQAVKQEADK
eukprot:gene11114-11268_t